MIIALSMTTGYEAAPTEERMSRYGGSIRVRADELRVTNAVNETPRRVAVSSIRIRVSFEQQT
jgi:hypothetical protein